MTLFLNQPTLTTIGCTIVVRLTRLELKLMLGRGKENKQINLFTFILH